LKETENWSRPVVIGQANEEPDHKGRKEDQTSAGTQLCDQFGKTIEFEL